MSDSTTASRPELRLQERAASLSLGANIALVCIKLAAGLASGSISVLAEAIQSLLDVIASGVILLMLRAAAAPPDHRHPYGHGKFENLTSLGQTGLIVGSGGYLLSEAIHRWQHPGPVRVDWGLAALTIALVTDFLVSRRLMRVARETGSHALEAEAVHLRGDMLSCFGVLTGLILVRLTGQPRLDSGIAAVMSILVILSALRLMRDTVRPLLDESLPAPEEAEVRRVLDADPRVLGYHRLRTRKAGAHRHMDVHILLDDALTFPEAHQVSEEVEGAIREALPNMDAVVHAEPYEEEMRHQQERFHLHPERR